MPDAATSQDDLVWLVQQASLLVALRDADRLVDTALAQLLTLCAGESAYFFEADRGKLRGIPKKGRRSDGQPLKNCDTRTQALVSEAIEQRRSLVATDQSGSVDPSQFGMRRSSGPIRARLLVVLPLICADGEVLGALYADAKELRTPPTSPHHLELFASLAASCLQNARLFERATNDLLTGLPNNSSFMFHLENALRDPTPERNGGVLLLDIDEFKRINQAAGAEAGDHALADIAATLRELLRSDGFVSRYGSDKFAVLLPHDATTSIEVRLRDIAERARAAVGTKQFFGITLSASLGGTGFVGGTESPQEVMARADDALASARQNGGSAQLAIRTKKI
jgi:diguanylate cyclase (GGDEF)-like protein